MLYDVITVGGGLAGSTLAKNLAEHGYRVLVLERETHFRDRVRGEQMHPWGVAEARALGLYESLVTAGGHQTRWWRTYQEATLIGDRDLAETTPHGVGSFNCYHPAMQEAVLRLAVEAGAEVRRGVTVEAVVPGSPPSVRVQEDGRDSVLQARLVIGADGRASQVRQWGGFSVSHDPDCLVIASTLLAGTPVPDDATYYVRGPEGNLLIAPLGNQRARTYFICRKSEGQRPLSGDTQVPAFLAACSTPALPASTIRSASEICLPPAADSLNSAWMRSSFRSTVASCAGWLACQSFCGASRIRAPLAPPRLSDPRKVDAEAQAVDTSCDTVRPEANTAALSASASVPSINSLTTGGSGSCQSSSSSGTSGPR